MRKIAILFAGGVNTSCNYPRYENDLRLAYTVLREKWGFQEKDIFIFLGFGKSMQYKNEKIATQIASRRYFVDKMEKIAQELTEEDCFVFVVSNHGTEHGDINMWERELLKKDEVKNYLGNIKSKKLVIMGQCYGGNYHTLNMQNTCLMTANEPEKVSFARLPDYEYDEFLYLFFKFFLEYTLEEEEKCKLSQIQQAFSYAFENDQYNPAGKNYKKIAIEGEQIIEIPQMNNNIADLSCFYA